MDDRWRSFAGLGAVAVVAVAAAIVPPARPAMAAAYRPSCNSGVYAPQLCTFALSTVVAQFAAVGEYAIVQPVRSLTPPPSCRNGGSGWVEQFRGSVRTIVEGRPVIGSVMLTLAGCPDEHPRLMARARYNGSERRWSQHRQEFFPYRFADLSVGPGEPGAPGRFSYFDEHNYPSTSGWVWNQAAGTLFRRHTGMSADATGRNDSCQEPASNGTCEYNGRYRDAVLAIDSSVSGRWARLQVALDTQPDVTRVTSQPAGTGWRITRHS